MIGHENRRRRKNPKRRIAKRTGEHADIDRHTAVIRSVIDRYERWGSALTKQVVHRLGHRGQIAAAERFEQRRLDTLAQRIER